MDKKYRSPQEQHSTEVLSAASLRLEEVQMAFSGLHAGMRHEFPRVVLREEEERQVLPSPAEQVAEYKSPQPEAAPAATPAPASEATPTANVAMNGQAMIDYWRQQVQAEAVSLKDVA